MLFQLYRTGKHPSEVAGKGLRPSNDSVMMLIMLEAMSLNILTAVLTARSIIHTLDQTVSVNEHAV
jgi:hypothetical protein